MKGEKVFTGRVFHMRTKMVSWLNLEPTGTYYELIMVAN